MTKPGLPPIFRLSMSTDLFPSVTLFLTPAEWANLPNRLAEPFYADLHRHNEQAVEIMRQAGRDDFWQMPIDLRRPELAHSSGMIWRPLKHRLLRFTISWRLTGSEVSLGEALRAVDELLLEKHWGAHFGLFGIKHADLKTADLWFNACFAREALWPALSSSQRSGLEKLLLEWALPAYLKGWEEADWWRHAEFNWGASVHGCAGLAALAVGDLAPDLSEQVLAHVREGLAYVLEAMPARGGWIEGVMYEATTLGHLTDFVAALHHVTGDDLGLTENRYLIEALDFRMRMVGLDGRVLNFSNCPEDTIESRLPHVYWWAHRCARPDWAGFQDAFPKPWWDTHGVFLDLEAFWMRQPGQPSQPFHHPMGLFHAREIDWLSWKRGATWLGFRSGWNGGNHSNLDLGQIIFGVGQTRLLVDPGYGAGQTAQHNCLTYRGHGQLHEARAKIFRVRELRHPTDGTQSCYLCCDLTAVQPATYKFHYRHCLVGERGWLLILDDLMTSQGRRAGVQGNLHFHFPIQTVAEGRMRLESQPGPVWIQFLTPVSALKTDQWQWGQQDRSTFHKLTYKPTRDLPIARLAVLLTVHNPDDARLEITGHEPHAIFSHAGDHFRIDLSEGSCTVEPNAP